MTRKDEVLRWLADDVTQQFISVIQMEIREAREKCILAAERGENATSAAATVMVLRELLTSGIEGLIDALEVKEAMRDGEGNEKNPEELHPSRFADALSQGDGVADIDGDPHAG
jgi:hypothetical protein